jgi:hypothetical protein
MWNQNSSSDMAELDRYFKAGVKVL